MASIPWRELLDLVGFVVALAALGFALKQFTDAREHTGKLRSLADEASGQNTKLKNLADQASGQNAQMSRMLDRLETLSKSLPTRFIGTFPDAVEPLAEFLNAAKSEVRILCDFAGYGSYSRPHLFAQYFDALRSRRVTDPKLKIHLSVYSRQAGNDALCLQFDKNKYNEIKSSKEFNDFFQIFKDRFPSPPADFAAWDNQNWEIEDDYRRALQSVGVDLKIVEKPVPVFIWLRDHSEALVSFQSSVEFGDITFRTSDKQFIDFFEQQVDHAWTNGKQYSPTGKGNQPLLANNSAATSSVK